MRPSDDSDIPAFRYLRRCLARRRFAQLDLRLRLELALLGLLLTGFVFWQVRGPLASLRLHGGVPAVIAALAVLWGTLGVLAGGMVAIRHARQLLAGAPGPPWLALPVSDAELARHLAWESSLLTFWFAIPAAGIWTAASGLVPWPGLIALTVPFVGFMILASRGGAALGRRLATWRTPGARDAVTRVLAVAAPHVRTRRCRPARWARQPGWAALCAKDLAMTRRIGALGRQLGMALAFWLLAAMAWRLPVPPQATDLPYAAAFVLSLLGSAALGEWLVALSGSDPFVTVRSLPLGVATVWGARFAWAALATLLLILTHVVAAPALSPHAFHLFIGWTGVATLAIAALAVNYGVTLFPRADIAQRLLGLSLGLAVAASLMIPLLGWVVLLSAVVHSARRLPQWSRLEEA